MSTAGAPVVGAPVAGAAAGPGEGVVAHNHHRSVGCGADPRYPERLQFP